jgi:hypothetical protein
MYNISSIILSIVLSFTVTLSPFISTHLVLLYHLIALLPHHIENASSSGNNKSAKKKEDVKSNAGPSWISENVVVDSYEEFSLLLAAKACYFIFFNSQLLMTVYSLTHFIKENSDYEESSQLRISNIYSSSEGSKNKPFFSINSPSTVFEELLIVPLLIINHPLVVSRLSSLSEPVDALPFSLLATFLSPVIFSPKLPGQTLFNNFFQNFISFILSASPSSSKFQKEVIQNLEMGKKSDKKNVEFKLLDVEKDQMNLTEISFAYFDSIYFDKDVTNVLFFKLSEFDQNSVLLGL